MPSPTSTIVGHPEHSKEDGAEMEKEPYALAPPAMGNVSTKAIPWRVKGPPLLMVLVFNCAVYWFSASLGPIKSTLKTELDINNAQYGVIASASSLVNTVFPLLSGVAMDYYGAEWTSFAASTAVFVGAVLAGGGASASSYGLLVAGEVVVGFGTITLEITQLKICSHWFFGSHLGLSLGLVNAVNRVIVVVAKATAIPIVDDSSWIWVIWAPAFIAGFVWVVNGFYVWYERRIEPQFRPLTGREAAKLHNDQRGSLKRELGKTWAVVWGLPAIFWFLTLTQLLQNATVQTMVSLQADMISTTRGAGLLSAGWISAVAQVPVIVLAPLTGAFFDRYGHRMHLVSISAVLWIAVFASVGWTQANAIGLTILQGVALAINLLPFTCSIPLLVPSLHQIGTAEGTFQSFINSGHVIVSIAAGKIQDLTPTGKQSYDNVFYFFIAIKAIDFLWGLSYILIDRYQLNSLLSRSERNRLITDDPTNAFPGDAREEEVVVKKGWMLRPSKEWTTAGLGTGAAMTVAAWAVYLIYSQGS